MVRKAFVRPYVKEGAELAYTPPTRPDMKIKVKVVAVMSDAPLVVIEYAAGQREAVLPRMLKPLKAAQAPVEPTARKRAAKRERPKISVAELVARLRELGCDDGDDRTLDLLRKHGLGGE